MARRIAPAGERERSRVLGSQGALNRAERDLKHAAEWLVLAGCPRAAKRVLDALRAVYAAQASTKGAMRHVEVRIAWTEGEGEGEPPEEHGQRQISFGASPRGGLDA